MSSIQDVSYSYHMIESLQANFKRLLHRVFTSSQHSSKESTLDILAKKTRPQRGILHVWHKSHVFANPAFTAIGYSVLYYDHSAIR